MTGYENLTAALYDTSYDPAEGKVYGSDKSPELQRTVLRLTTILGETDNGLKLSGAHAFRRACIGTLATYTENFEGRFADAQATEARQLDEENSQLPLDDRPRVTAARAALRISEAAFMQTLAGPCEWGVPSPNGKEPDSPYALYRVSAEEGFVPLGGDNPEYELGIEHRDYWFYVYQERADRQEVTRRVLSVRFTYGDSPRFRVLHSFAMGVVPGQELVDLV